MIADNVYIHNAWNRLVQHQLDWDQSGFMIDNSEYEYNGLHWRTVKRNKTLFHPAQERVMYYSAYWQMIEEHIDDDPQGSPGVDRIAVQVWGVRYIDDPVLRRVYDVGGEEVTDYYHLPDALYSTRAMITADGANPQVLERVRYEAYGRGTHRWPGDFNDDGVVDSADQDMFSDPNHSGNLGTADYNVALDLSRDGVIDAADEALFTQWLNKGALTQRISDPEGPDNIFGFKGYVFSGEIDMYISRHRYYDPTTGRWMQRDPAGPVDGVNLYQYVRGRAINGRDPMGLMMLGPDGGDYEEPKPPPHLDPNDPRNDKSTGCGIKVKQEDIGLTRHLGRRVAYGHRWIQIDDPGRGPGGSAEYRTPKVSNIGRQRKGFVSPYSGFYGGRPDCDTCAANDADQNEAHTEWDVEIDPDAQSWHWVLRGLARPTRDGVSRTPGRWERHPRHPDPGVLRFGPSQGVHIDDATCEQIRECLYSYRSRGAPYLPDGFNNCRTEADNALAACGLSRGAGRRTPAGERRDRDAERRRLHGNW